jgi:hypothetical protein
MEALQALETRPAQIALFMRGRALRAKQRRTRARALGERSYKSIWRKVNEIANFPASRPAARHWGGLFGSEPLPEGEQGAPLKVGLADSRG